MRKIVPLFLALVLLAACSNSKPAANTASEQKPEAPKPADTLTGREVFQKTYVAARGWAADAKPYRLQSEPTSDANGHNGKSAIWRASFASEARRGIKTWVWSGAGDPKSRGIMPGSEDTFNPNNASTRPFDTAYLKSDSSKAFEVAQSKGGDKLLAKAADTPIVYVLDWDSRAGKLVWHVIYGSNPFDAKLRIAVDAATGEFFKTEK